MADLDKSQPYFHVHGDVGGAAFEQGGKLFDSQGKQLGVTLTAEADADADEAGGKGKAKGKRAKAKSDPVETAGEAVEATGAATAVDAQLAAQGAE